MGERAGAGRVAASKGMALLLGFDSGAQAVEVRGKRERGSVADASSEQARPFLSRSGVALRAAPRKAEGGDGR